MKQKFSSLENEITQCEKCPRLRTYCKKIAKEKRKAYETEIYWGKPISGFGDPRARLILIGLAPGAHGANRTGRIFTGDRSGEWLYRALYKSGFSNQMESIHAHDSLRLRDAYVSCVVKCAPPDNKPSPLETQRCLPYLENELALLRQKKVFITLGKFALDGLWMALVAAHPSPKIPKPKFKHGAQFNFQDFKILCSYHPSQQNTFTKRLTEPMFDSIFKRASELLSSSS